MSYTVKFQLKPRAVGTLFLILRTTLVILEHFGGIYRKIKTKPVIIFIM